MGEGFAQSDNDTTSKTTRKEIPETGETSKVSKDESNLAVQSIRWPILPPPHVLHSCSPSDNRNG